MQSQPKTLAFLLIVFAAVFTWSAIRPHDYFTWLLEVFPALIGLAILGATYRRFQFTTLVYVLLLGHAIVLMVGGHYTYAEVPIGFWVRDHFRLGQFHFVRNHYDRFGHFLQGFVPALVTREVLLRNRIVRKGGWLTFLTFSVCMMITAVYELFEYAVAMATGSAADAFLGGQGDPWDTQNDMLMCLIGASLALLVVARWQDRLLARPDRAVAAAATHLTNR